MNIKIVHLGNVVFESDELHADVLESTFKKLVKYKRNLPNSYNRHKQCRKYCYNVDKKVSKLLGKDVFFSSYSGNQYKIIKEK